MRLFPVCRLVTTTLVAAFCALAPCSLAVPKPDAQLAIETRALVRLLENLHYNRDAVKRSDYAQLIPDTMAAFDRQRLFFLATDLEELTTRHKADALYWNLSALGRLDPAFEIHSRYEERVRTRAAWVFDRLTRDFDFTVAERYTFDRDDEPWPADLATADALWEQRLKFELLQELLGKKNDRTLDAARETVRKRYERLLRDFDDNTPAEIAEVFLTALASLYDPHSNYFAPEAFEEFGIAMRLQLFGIGALLEMQDDICTIKEIIPGGPAALSRELQPGDKILAVAQGATGEPVDVIGMKLNKIVQNIRGEKGTQVRLIVKPADAEDPAARREIILARDLINLDSARAHGAIFQVPSEMSAAPAKRVGVVSLPSFYGPDGSGKPGQNSATADVANIIAQLQNAGIDALVLDLNRNGGGLLNEAVSLTGLFIRTGPVVQVRAYTGEVKVDEDDDPAVLYAGPLVVYTSRFSASASEIVAGALQNYGRAVVVGDRATHGKGTVQTLIELKSQVPQLARSGKPSGASKLTVQKFYLPNGDSTQRRGVVADIALPSINEFRKIGEADLPHALAWDEIGTALFDQAGLSVDQVASLRARSEARRTMLPEFAWLQRGIQRYEARRQDEKSVSLNLEERRAGKAADTVFREEAKAERKTLEHSSAYQFSEYFVGPPPAPRIRAATKPEDMEGEEEEEEELDVRYFRMDVYLRESLRVAADLQALLMVPPPHLAKEVVVARPLTAP
jgi:carboxyl-terminal processing protease